MQLASSFVLFFGVIALIEAGAVYNRPIRSPQLTGSSSSASSQTQTQGGLLGRGGGSSSSSSANAESSSFGGGFGGGAGSSSSASASAQSQGSSKGVLGGRPGIGYGAVRPGVGLAGPGVVGRPGGFGPGPIHYSGPIRPINQGFGARPLNVGSSSMANAQAVSVGK